MHDESRNVSRRKFMAASSAAVAAPLVMNMAGGVAASETTQPAASAQQKTYFINDNCCLCPPLRCKLHCPVGAHYFDGEKMAINPDKCIRCGTCYKMCPLGAVVDSSAPAPDATPHAVITKECDFLVIGGGLSGMVAAATAADLSKKKVIVLERSIKSGGCGYFPIGVGMQKGGGAPGGGGGQGGPSVATGGSAKEGSQEAIDNAVRQSLTSTNLLINPKLVANIKGAKVRSQDWFYSWANTADAFSNFETERSGRFILAIIEKCKTAGVEVLNQHSAYELIMGDNGQISGVKAKDLGGTVIVNCKQCLIATGTVVNNNYIMERSVPQFVNAFTRRTGHRYPYNTGDGVAMAEKIGIPIDYSSIFVHFTGVNSSLAEATTRILDRKPDALNVNSVGERWTNEALVTDDFLPALLKQPRSMFWHIMDSKIIVSGVLGGMMGAPGGGGGQGGPGGGGQGGPGGGGPGGSGGQGGPGGQAGSTAAAGAAMAAPGAQGGKQSEKGESRFDQSKTSSMAEFSYAPMESKPDMKEVQRIASLPGRHIVIADTLEELAEKIGIEKQVLMATVKRYNELCAKGHDDDFFKETKYLTKIEKGPFYASSHVLGHDGAFGGLHVNENLQVMGKNGPIANLYASGDITTDNTFHLGGKRGGGIEAEGGWATTSGYLVGETVGKQLKSA